MLTHNKLIITRVFDAPVEKVWKYWSEPEYFKKWWGPKIFSCPVSKVDFRVGGKYLHCMLGLEGDFKGKEFWSTGVYKEIIPLKKIVSTDSFADENGNVVPASHYGMGKDFPMEMIVTVTFEDLGNKTKMILKHEGMPESDSKGAQQGWSESFDKLAKEVSNK
ncbi:SRPBCC domain-containing protein [Candidatus Gottesmanbacteria bacterium]|nr:SRPBCC domain-containing protein [Candidatus Gottesmanbacteria bacterium]